MSTVHVSNISPQTSEKELREFFSFCGKITSLSLTPASTADSTQSASVTFERDTAAKTALLLDNTKLGPSQVKVEHTSSLDDIAGSKAVSHSADEADRENEIRQEDKPRTAIFAEYLSQGYVIGDQALQKGIALDKQHGVSTKFTSFLNKTLTTVDSKLHATDRAKAVDTSYGVTTRAVGAKDTVLRYFENALATPTGMKIRKFYDQGEKQVLDIHNEARRLADLKKSETAKSGTEKQKCTCAGVDGNCTCAPGTCACEGCTANKTAADTAATYASNAASTVQQAASSATTTNEKTAI